MTGAHYAVLFKTFTIDDFVKRRLAHVVAAAPSGDVYLMIDETQQSAGHIDFDRTIRYEEADLVRIGLPHISQGALFWYNADYPLYYFRHLRPEYDTIVTVEYDAVPNIDIDDLVHRFRAENFDLVGRTIANRTPDTYWWTSTMLHFYRMDQIRPYQICATIMSARAIDHLAATRKRHAASGVADVRHWPIGETFVGTELSVAGFRMAELSDFGKLTRYDWWPPISRTRVAVVLWRGLRPSRAERAALSEVAFQKQHPLGLDRHRQTARYDGCTRIAALGVSTRSGQPRRIAATKSAHGRERFVSGSDPGKCGSRCLARSRHPPPFPFAADRVTACGMLHTDWSRGNTARSPPDCVRSSFITPAV